MNTSTLNGCSSALRTWTGGGTDGRHLGTASVRSCSVRRQPEWEEVIKKIRRQ